MEVKSKDFLVDVPVMVYIWIRPELQRRQFEVIKKARPSKLFLVSDGGRNEKEWNAIRQNREMYDTEVDWNCEVHKLYKEKNYGTYFLMREVGHFVFDNVDRAITMEDDILPSISFFRYCAELLETYKDDERICMICGFNHVGVSQDTPYDYLFARKGSIWGTAIWKRTWNRYLEYGFRDDPYSLALLNDNLRYDKYFKKAVNSYAKSDVYEGHTPGEEFFCQFCVCAHHQLYIIPKKNLISNIGVTKDSWHSSELKLVPRGLRKVYNSRTYTVQFPLKHPQYIIPDLQYERKRNWIMNYNHSLLALLRCAETWMLRIRYGEFKYYFKRSLKHICCKKTDKNL